MIKYGQLYVHPKLDLFVRNELVPGIGIDIDSLWNGFANIVKDLAPRNAALLEKRDTLQSKIDTWYREKKGTDIGLEKEKEFLKEIGYLQDEPDPFTICPENVDPEISTLAGPQLVVPVDNARYAINAANSRWGSLYDALYGTNVIAPDESGVETKPEYNPRRGQAVIDMAMDFLDTHFSLMNGSHKQVKSYAVVDEKLVPPLSDSSKFVGYQGNPDFPDAILLKNNGLHVEINIDRKHRIGSQHPAGVSDIILESAISTIMDCEDSVAAVDAEDKVNVYRNWFGIMKGDLCVEVNKVGRNLCRLLNPDRFYQKPDGKVLTLPGRSLLMVRNVGMHVLTDAVQLDGVTPIPETFLDGLMTTLAGLYDLQGKSSVKNSRTGSIYIVKPKMHGPDEVALQVDFFSQIEKLLKIDKNTLKMGIMDEERRTTINLAACICAARERIVFINTGFLDRTGDEIHTAMHAGPVLPKNDIKKAIWLSAYEDSNVDTGLKCGMHGKAQIGKGMWAMPDQMAEMIANKIDHLRAGASTAWVPSPTAATLHALHYHVVDVAAIQQKLLSRTAASVDDILTPPLLGRRTLSATEISEELENNAQGILGYMVRWIDKGIGCSKVPDIHNVHLMEDRATLRISSQHLANWLLHGIINKEQVIKTFEKMAVIVDRQNQNDPGYKKMATNFSTNIAFQAALELVFKGVVTPNGYTEAILSSRRREF
jgi:malate synthase